MTRRFELTPFAKSNLIKIAVWTDENFGQAQAGKYEEMLLKKCRELVAGTAHFQDCAVIKGSTRKTGLYFTRAGRHILLFKEAGDTVIILDFIHAASDLVAAIDSNLGR